jgi:hypothetical protein
MRCMRPVEVIMHVIATMQYCWTTWNRTEVPQGEETLEVSGEQLVRGTITCCSQSGIGYGTTRGKSKVPATLACGAGNAHTRKKQLSLLVLATATYACPPHQEATNKVNTCVTYKDLQLL